jgi:hypothetical protein
MIHALLSYGNAGLARALKFCAFGYLEAKGGLKIWFIFERLHYLTYKSLSFINTISRIQEQAAVSGL